MTRQRAPNREYTRYTNNNITQSGQFNKMRNGKQKGLYNYNRPPPQQQKQIKNIDHWKPRNTSNTSRNCGNQIVDFQTISFLKRIVNSNWTWWDKRQQLMWAIQMLSQPKIKSNNKSNNNPRHLTKKTDICVELSHCYYEITKGLPRDY